MTRQRPDYNLSKDLGERRLEAQGHRDELLRPRCAGLQEDIGSLEVETGRGDNENNPGQGRIDR